MKLDTSIIVKIIDNTVYLVMFLVGFYFVYQGDAVDKFIKRRTSFIEYLEPLKELPTFITYIDSYNRGSYKYGVDFNISFIAKGKPTSNLTYGENSVDGHLKVHFEPLYTGSFFKITPLNFPHKLAQYYILKYIFENMTGISKVIMGPSTEDNAVAVKRNYHDGDHIRYRLRIGEYKQVTITPEKIMYLKHLEKCREKSFTEEWLKKYVHYAGRNCSNPCRPTKNYGWKLNKITLHLPNCTTTEEKRCKELAFELSKKEVIQKPCSILIYKGVKATKEIQYKNQANYRLVIPQPPKVKVKEEYLVYDMVSLISLFGGFMGICVGLSFYSTSGAILRGMEMALNWKKKRYAKNQKVAELPRFWTKAEEEDPTNPGFK